MKKHIDEVRKEASRVPACIIKKDADHLIVSDSNCIMARTTNVPSVSHEAQKANALLLTHCLNTHQVLLDALKKQTLEYSEFRDAMNCGSTRVLDKSYDIIEAASSVEVEE